MLKLGILPFGDWQRVKEKEFWKKSRSRSVGGNISLKHYKYFWGIYYIIDILQNVEILCYIPETSSRINALAISVNLCSDCKYKVRHAR